MRKPEEIEAILGRLMPPALSEQSRLSIESMLDELAGGDPVSCETGKLPGARRRPAFWIKSASGIAAAVAVGVVVQVSRPVNQLAAVDPASTPEAGFILVSESDRIESIEDAGWQEADDGSAVRAMRVNAVEEDDFFDEETGLVVRVSEPREEIVFMPVSTF